MRPRRWLHMLLSALPAMLVAGGKVWPETTPSAAWRLPVDGEFMAPRFSPDGRHIAMTTPGYRGLYLVRADGTDLRRITDEAAAGYDFAFSPDGRHLAFKTRRTDKTDNGVDAVQAIQFARLDAPGVRTLAERRGDLGVPVWISSDRLAYTTGNRLQVTDLAGKSIRSIAGIGAHRIGYVKAVKGYVTADAADHDRIVLIEPSGQRTYLTVEKDGRFHTIQVSPGGDRILAHNLNDGHIYVMDLPGGKLRDLGEGDGARFCPQGRRIACAVTRDDGHRLTAADIVIIDIATARRTRLTHTANRLEMHPDWAPDGQHLIYEDASNGSLYIHEMNEGM